MFAYIDRHQSRGYGTLGHCLEHLPQSERLLALWRSPVSNSGNCSFIHLSTLCCTCEFSLLFSIQNDGGSYWHSSVFHILAAFFNAHSICVSLEWIDQQAVLLGSLSQHNSILWILIATDRYIFATRRGRYLRLAGSKVNCQASVTSTTLCIH